MNSHFFLICFGILGSYAVLRTMRRGWLRVLFVFFLALCLIKIGFDQIFPAPVAVAQQSVPTMPDTPTRTAETGGVHQFLAGLANDRCVVEHLQDTPLGPVAYMIQFRRFLKNYQQMQGGTLAAGASIGAVSQVVSATFNDAPEPGKKPGLCDQFTTWLQAQAQSGIQTAVGAVNVR